MNEIGSCPSTKDFDFTKEGTPLSEPTSPTMVATARPQAMTHVRGKPIQVRSSSNTTPTLQSSAPQQLEAGNTPQPQRKGIKQLIRNLSTKQRHAPARRASTFSLHRRPSLASPSTTATNSAAGRAMVTSLLATVPTKHNNTSLRTHEQPEQGFPIVSAASNFIIQLCKQHPLTCPIPDAAPAKLDSMVNKDTQYWMNAVVSTGSRVSAVLKSHVKADAVYVDSAEGEAKKALLPLWVVGMDETVGKGWAMKLEVAAEVVDTDDEDALGGFDAVFGLNTLVQYRGCLDFGCGKLLLREPKGEEDEEERVVAVEGVFSVFDEGVETLPWLDGLRKLQPWVTGVQK